MTAWRAWGRYLLAAAVSATITWVAFGSGRPVPILDLFDLGVHEVGHLLTGFLPDLVMFLAGSAAQAAVPLALGAYFLWVRGEWASAGFCTAWAGTSVRDVSVYIADAPRGELPLLGGTGEGDWTRILGPEQLARATTQRTSGPNTVLLDLDIQFGLGFMVHAGLLAIGGPRSFGHFGAGGSVGWADPDAELAFGYVLNRMDVGLAGDARSAALIGAVYEAAGRLGS